MKSSIPKSFKEMLPSIKLISEPFLPAILSEPIQTSASEIAKKIEPINVVSKEEIKPQSEIEILKKEIEVLKESEAERLRIEKYQKFIRDYDEAKRNRKPEKCRVCRRDLSVQEERRLSYHNYCDDCKSAAEPSYSDTSWGEPTPRWKL
jgi:hypothetical protein